MTTAPAAPEQPRKRLGMGQAKPLLLDAAREVFATRGFQGARTKEIADKAGVSEALLYRHFGSKAGLFEEAILEPVNSFVAEFVERWRTEWDQTRPFHETVGAFMEGMYDLMREHRSSVLALLAAQAFEDEMGGSSDHPPLFAMLADLEEVASVESKSRHFIPAPALTTRVAVTLAVAMGLLEDFLFGPPEAQHVTRDAVITEMTMMVVTGISQRANVPPPPEPGPAKP
jgi:AcrR family transcriptional regulator